jgi:hypothetical protein
VPISPSQEVLFEDDSMSNVTSVESQSSEYVPERLHEPQSHAELVASRLNEWNLLDSGCKITSYRNRHQNFATFFEMSENLCYCSNVGLFDLVSAAAV